MADHCPAPGRTAAVLSVCLLAASCVCPGTVLNTAISPDGALEAVTYDRECGGAVAPVNLHVKVGARGKSDADILIMYETPYIAHVEWSTARKLQVMIDCPSDPTVFCEVPGNKPWDISASSAWRDVKVSFSIGPRLSASGSAEAVKQRLSQHRVGIGGSLNNNAVNGWTSGLGRLVAGVFLLMFAGLGVAHALNPDRFIARSRVRKGGELLTAWNRLGFRLFGVAFTGVALYMLFHLFVG